MNIEPIDSKFWSDMISYNDACFYLFSLGPKWRFPTPDERRWMLSTHISNVPMHSHKKIHLAWDSNDILVHSYTQLYLVPVRDLC